jgi:hypothetical protein
MCVYVNVWIFVCMYVCECVYTYLDMWYCKDAINTENFKLVLFSGECVHVLMYVCVYVYMRI